MTVPFIGGEYAGGASLLTCGRRVGVVRAKTEGVGTAGAGLGVASANVDDDVEVFEDFEDRREAKRFSRSIGDSGAGW